MLYGHFYSLRFFTGVSAMVVTTTCASVAEYYLCEFNSRSPPVPAHAINRFVWTRVGGL